MTETNNKQIKLGVLDFCTITPGMTPREVLIDTLKLAVQAELWGYKRYWLGEHFVSGVAHASPVLMMMALAGKTKNIRIGTGSLLLHYYNCLRVANDFSLLSLLFPGRIDLGLGRSNSTDDPFSIALLDNEDKKLDVASYEQKVGKVIDYLRGKDKVSPIPKVRSLPEVWIQGSRRSSMLLAAKLGLSFTFSLFHRGCFDYISVIEEYKDSFQSSDSSPTYNVAIAGTCTETEIEAKRIQAQAEKVNEFIVPRIVGTPSQCFEQLKELQYKYAIDEFIFLDVGESTQERVRSYALLAEGCRILN